MKFNIKKLISFFVIGAMCYTICAQSSALLPYKNPTLPVNERTLDLISRMTIEEKIGQLLCPMGWEMYEKDGDKVSYSKKFGELILKQHVGMLWAVYRADPWTKKTIENGLNPRLAAEVGNALQRYVIENTRLGIPLFIAEEAPHGHMAIGATVFPSGIGQASTWNPDLLEKMGAAISKEIRTQGGHISYGPVLDLSRDARWSRVEETFGEDPVLTAILGAAVARGNGAGNLHNQYSTITTLKHFIAYGIPEGGHNGNTALVGMREVFENFLPPFQKSIDAGALSVMTAYNSVDGIPCTANSFLLKDILKDRWGFKGFVVSDLVSIDGLMGQHHISKSLGDAGSLALKSGVDVDLGSNSFAQLEVALKNGRISLSDLDSAVYRVLKLKFEMGLFENPYVKVDEAVKNVRTKEHIAIAYQLAKESIVLLENKKQTLPLSKNLRVAVIGPNADNPYNMLGDYTAPQNREDVVTVLDGIRSKVGKAHVEYIKGCAIRDTTNLSIPEAVSAALRSDVAVVVVGGSSARDFKTKYIDTGAAITSLENISDMESGEGFDRSSLDLMGKQLDLLNAIKATGKPVVVIYIQGRPLNMNWAQDNADALLTAWYPGQEGGAAIADVLFGDYNPAGRLPISVPRSTGQIPVYYNLKNPWGHDYVEMTSEPLYSFGYGLSYTQFEYKDIEVKQHSLYDFQVSFTLKNSGNYDGEEVAQLYVRDEYASVVQPIKQLKHFKRIFLKKGEERLVVFHINKDDLSIVDKGMERIVEPGDFSLMIGASSDDIRLNATIKVDSEYAVVTGRY